MRLLLLLIVLFVFVPFASLAQTVNTPPECIYTVAASDVGGFVLTMYTAQASCTDAEIHLTNSTYDFANTVASKSALPDVTINLTIYGNDSQILLNNGFGKRFVTVTSSASLNLYDLSISGGRVEPDYGGAIYNAGSLYLNNVSAHDNFASLGGAIYNSASLISEDSSFVTNSAGGGGAIYNEAESFFVDYSGYYTFNHAEYGGAIYASMNTGTSFVGNTSATIALFNSWMRNNHANIAGGGLYTNGNTYLESTSFRDNSAAEYGGGIYASNSTTILEIVDGTFYVNGAMNGGAIYHSDNLILTDSIMRSNNALRGGAIYSDGVVEIRQSDISGNDANNPDGLGGAIYSTADMVITQTIFSYNSTPDFGGAIYNESGHTSITNTEFLQNYIRSGFGKGAAIFGKADIDLTHVTIVSDGIYDSFNQNQGRSIYMDVGSTATVMASILAQDDEDNCWGDIVSADYNLTLDDTCNLTAPNDLIVKEMYFQSTSINGHYIVYGLTEFSPANDRVPLDQCIGTDLIGSDRLQGNGCDVGAYEFNLDGLLYGPIFNINTTDENATSCTIDYCTIRAAIAQASNTIGSFTLQLPADTFFVDVDLLTSNIMTIRGAGIDQTIISGDNNSARSFEISAAGLILENLTIRDFSALVQFDNANAGCYSNQTILRDVVIRDNHSAVRIQRYGCNSRAEILVDEVLIMNNSSSAGGGLYFRADEADLMIRDSSFINNTASQGGGGIYLNIQENTIATIENTTISNNTSSDFAGGLGYYTAFGAAIQINHSTIAHNVARNSGGGLRAYRETDVTQVDLIGSIISNNQLQNGSYNNCRGQTQLVSEGYNILGNTGNCSLFSLPTDVIDEPTSLAPLSQAGNAYYHALLPDNPAINAIPTADCLLDHDQLGNTRPEGRGCDSGAYEMSFSPYDTSQNGRVSPVDAMFVINRFGFDPANPDDAAADVNGDGSINNNDAQLILDYLMP